MPHFAECRSTTPAGEMHLKAEMNGATAPGMSLRELGQAVVSGKVKAAELVSGYLERIAERNPKINAYLSVVDESAQRTAQDLDAAARRGDPLGPLAGVPIGIKDVIAIEGMSATAGSRILEGYAPPYTATAVRRLKEAGAVVLGKLNCDEFAMGSSNENSAYGVVRNPAALDRVPGGSSGGSAAAVAAEMAAATLGSDTGGSIRQPASFCGVVGVLPTYGRVSRYGLIAFASSLDRIGPFARTVEDAATMLGVIAGYDPLDATSSARPVPDYVAECQRPVEGLRVGVPGEYFAEGLDAQVKAAVEKAIESLRAQGCVITPVSLPHTRYAVPTYYVLATAEASANLERFDGVRYGYRAPGGKTLSEMYRETREGGFGREVKRRILLGTYVLSAGYYDAYYRKAQQVRRVLAEDFLKAFEKVDVIVTPTAPTPAFRIGEKTDDPVSMYLADIYTVTASLAGICGVSVPCGVSSEGLPIGAQVLGPHFGEGTVFRAARGIEAGLAGS
jgi:aspartyl-tRNA(Asn)/glutamyl-tRNA(Gln) amidotransferase subunit A